MPKSEEACPRHCWRTRIRRSEICWPGQTFRPAANVGELAPMLVSIGCFMNGVHLSSDC